MSDHIEAMARAWQKQSGVWPYDDLPDMAREDVRADVREVWAAGVGALIAHKPCGGKGWDCPVHTNVHDFEDGCGADCPGPHTVIVKGDGTKLYADPWMVVQYEAETPGAIAPLPSEWRIE